MFQNVTGMWTVKKKLMGCALTTALIAGVVGGIGSQRIMVLTHHMEEMVSLSRMAESFAEIELLLIEQVKEEKDFLLSSDVRHVAAHKEVEARLNTALSKAVETAEKSSAKDGLAALLKVKKENDDYKSVFEQIVKLVKEQDTEQAVKLSQEKSNAEAAQMLKEMKGLIEQTGKLIEADEKEALALAQMAVIFMSVVSGLGVALALGLGWLIAARISKPLGRARDVLMAVAEGDFTQRMELESKDELGQMAQALNRAVSDISDALRQVREAAESSSLAAQQLQAATEQVASGAQEQASSLEETAASLEQITGTVKQTADNSRQANQLAEGARDTADNGGKVVTDAVQAMDEINKSSKKIANIITTIDEIAFQTNLLALNAAVEAARAGEQGRGFAVVASEVRNLAQRSAAAAKEIKDLIEDSVQKVEVGSDLVSKSGENLQGIVTSVKRVTDIIAEIAAASKEQSSGVDQVNKAVSQMDQVVQANAAQTEELSSTAQTLAAQAEEMQALVSRFKLTDGQGGTIQLTAAMVHSEAAPALAPIPARSARAKTKKNAAVSRRDFSQRAPAANGHMESGFEEF